MGCTNKPIQEVENSQSHSDRVAVKHKIMDHDYVKQIISAYIHYVEIEVSLNIPAAIRDIISVYLDSGYVRPNITKRSKYKVVVVGDEKVGKTSIIARFMHDHYDPTYQATVGIAFSAKYMYLEDAVIELLLWDTGGQERFRSLIPCYIRYSSVAIIVYDITNEESFKHTHLWVSEVREEKDDNVLVILLGNKCDEQRNRQVTTLEGHKKAIDLNAIFYEVSAKESDKSNDSIKSVFKEIAEYLNDIAV